MAASITDRHPDADIELVSSSGGRFEVESDGRLIFSKKKLRRFPSPEEILRALAEPV
ncbi:MAG: Rdx family protein [Gemmatimonadetes bacterium]|nr:Rdx family protein [Gemmatimonadota bacterium]